ncbi:hypothetical protein, partial [Shewanella algae]|uniref:hypothetical protein n=1 Tax=Shewanella algae TaxID=38313 RepID=UPI001F3B583D
MHCKQAVSHAFGLHSNQALPKRRQRGLIRTFPKQPLANATRSLNIFLLKLNDTGKTKTSNLKFGPHILTIQPKNRIFA